MIYYINIINDYIIKMWVVTYKGIFITRSLIKPDNLKNLLIYKGSSKLID